MRGAATLRHDWLMNAGSTTPAADSPVTAGRRRILARTRLDFWLDALLLVAYTLAYSLGFTGIATHEWWITPGRLEALIPGRIQSRGSTEEVPRRAA